ncbi:MAG: UrcA family protein [Pseudomonadota bacterium]
MNKLALAFALSFAACATPALADGPPTQTVTVQVSDLNLQTGAGRAALDNRLQAAIQKVCRVHKSPGLPAWIRFRKCVDAKQVEIQPLRQAAIEHAQTASRLAER